MGQRRPAILSVGLKQRPIERRPPLNRNHLTKFSTALRRVLGAQHLTARARESGHCRRLRDITPQRLVCALVEALGIGRVETIADLLRSFNALTGLTTRYKAFYNRLAKPEFPRFLQHVYRDLLCRLSQQVLRPVGALNAFTDIVIQDGSSFAIHDALQKVFGGRFTKIRPAAVEVHTCVSLFQDQVLRAAVAPDKDGERAFLPSPTDLQGKLLLHDRGYQSLDYWEEVQQAGGFFLGRGKIGLNPWLRRVQGPHGRLPRFEGRWLQEVRGRLPRCRLDLEVEWDRPAGRTLQLRIVLIWVPDRKDYTLLVTNVKRRILTAKQVGQVYRLRWQIELLFKEWKSYANLHEFTTANPAIAEGLIWASLCAAALKRSLAHASQRMDATVPISTRIAAMCGVHILPELVRCALHGFEDLLSALQRIIRFLKENARRAHPKRDRRRGRMQFGLEYVG